MKDIAEIFVEQYGQTREQEMSLQDYLNACRDDPGLDFGIDVAVLPMQAVDHIGQRLDTAPVLQVQGRGDLAVGRIEQLAGAQIR